MSSCPSSEQLALYRERRLDAECSARVEAHLAECSPCRTTVGEDKGTMLLDDLRVVLDRRTATQGPCTATPIDIEGQQIGQYGIGRLLGEGGMARVYRAVDGQSGREVAFKMLKPQYQADQSVCARFAREVRSMSSIKHSNVVHIHEFLTLGNTSAIVMELLTGGSLRDKLDAIRTSKASLSVSESVDLIICAARGVGAAHKVGIVHRDIKPSNLLLNERGEIKVADFGAILMLEGTTWLTGVGQQIGTPAYMSPEQCRGKRVTPASDVYSLGASLFELLTTRVPFEVEEASPFAIMLKQISEAAPDPRQWREDIPRWLAAVVARSLSKNPEDRYPDANALAEALIAGPAGNDEMDKPSGASDMQIDLGVVRKQLQQLPQTAIVCWACRCARRVQHLNSDPRVEQAISMAEATVMETNTQSTQSLSRALTRIRTLRAASLKAAYTDEAPTRRTGAAESARAAAAAAAAAAARCIDDAAADAAFAARNAVAALQTAGQSVRDFWHAARKDYRQLLHGDLGREGTMGKPIPREFFGQT